MAYPEDPDFSGVDALPDPNAAPKLSTELDALATAIQTTATGVNGDAQGRTPDEVVAAANAAVTATRSQAVVAAALESATKILKDAVAAWKKNAPKKVELDKAEKRLTDAGTALASAQKAYDDAKDDTAKVLIKPVLDAAVVEQQVALLNLQTLKNKRKTADEAYERERKRAALVLKGVTTATESSTGSGETGTQSGGTSSSSTGSRSTGTGTPATRTASPTGTPKPTTSSPTATTPSAETPSKYRDTSTSDLTTLLAAAQQQNQQGQGQQQAQPTATQPQQAQQQNPGDKDKEKGKDDPNGKPIDVDDLIREGALPASAAAVTLTGVGGGNPISTPAPVASTPSTTFRPAGTQLPGVGLGGTPAVNAQNPVTSGQSATGLHTSSDVSGRSTPTAQAFSPSPAGAETKTSGATGNAAQQGTPLTQRGAGSGMPAMPMSPMMGGAAPTAGGTGKASGDTDPTKILRRLSEEQRLLTGQDTLGEAVRGGTIAQNRPESGAA